MGVRAIGWQAAMTSPCRCLAWWLQCPSQPVANQVDRVPKPLPELLWLKEHPASHMLFGHRWRNLVGSGQESQAGMSGTGTRRWSVRQGGPKLGTCSAPYLGHERLAMGEAVGPAETER